MFIEHHSVVNGQGVILGTNPVDGEWYPAKEAPRPAVYHKYAKQDVFETLYPDLLPDEEEEPIEANSIEALQELLTSEEPKVSIKVTAPIQDTQNIIIPEGKEVTLILDADITAGLKSEDRHHYAIDNYGTLTLKGNGATISARGVENFGTMIVEDGVTIESIDVIGGAAIWNEGDLIINGGTFKSTQPGSVSNIAGAGCLNNRGTCTINKGTFQGASLRTYAVISSGEMTIMDADVKGAHGGLSVDSGTCVVNAGTFESTEYYGLYVSNDAKGGDPEDADVIINGGTFTGKVLSVWVGSDVNSPVNSVIEINGGTFTGPLRVQKNVSEGAGIVKVPEGFTIVENEDGSKTINPPVPTSASRKAKKALTNPVITEEDLSMPAIAVEK